MINIRKNISENKVILQLKGATTISAINVFYLFEFIPTNINNVVRFVGTDLSSYIDRYNYFKINGNLFQSGEYTYKIYQQTSPSNTDPNLSDGMIQHGLCMVEVGRATSYKIETTKQKATFKTR